MEVVKVKHFVGIAEFQYRQGEYLSRVRLLYDKEGFSDIKDYLCSGTDYDFKTVKLFYGDLCKKEVNTYEELVEIAQKENGKGVFEVQAEKIQKVNMLSKIKNFLKS